MRQHGGLISISWKSPMKQPSLDFLTLEEGLHPNIFLYTLFLSILEFFFSVKVRKQASEKRKHVLFALKYVK
jgi:hypothetical protein